LSNVLKIERREALAEKKDKAATKVTFCTAANQFCTADEAG
jgi:hypothetical protein